MDMAYPISIIELFIIILNLAEFNPVPYSVNEPG
jgi:PDZ domain-containing secreted protein